MNDKPVEETIADGIDYEEVVIGKPPSPKIDFEIFISHCTRTGTEEEQQQRNLVTEIVEQIEKDHKLTIFLDTKDMHSSPVTIMNNSLETSRILVPICTPQYIKKFKDSNSWVNIELGTFLTWSNTESKERIIPVLVGITRKEFAVQGQGIAVITNKKSVEIPPNFTTDKSIVKAKVNEIILIYKDYLKQWEPTS